MYVYTIGHSNHTQDELLDLLVKTKIDVLVDVRSKPSSRWAPFADRDTIGDVLRSVGIRYVYMGDTLGGQPSDPDAYSLKTGKVDYQRVQGKDYFRTGIRRILEGLTKYRVCIMCAEEDPTSCHRNLLVAASLRREGVTVFHIRGDGRIQTDDELWREKAGVAASQYQLLL